MEAVVMEGFSSTTESGNSMKLYKVTIHPTSSFMTSLKGDTLFGQFCWAVFYACEKNKLKGLLETYKEGKPFVIVSDAFPVGYLPKPKMPMRLLKELKSDKKKNRKKLWLTKEELLEGNYEKARTNRDINNQDHFSVTIHNALNYKTFQTEQGFDPYGLKGMNLASKEIYFLVDESQLTEKEFNLSLMLFSNMGYGKKASIGKGRFEIEKVEEKSFIGRSNAFMTLSPFSPQGLEAKEIFYEPFTRFGKFGASRATKNAFKKPLLLADVASVVIFEQEQACTYVGRPIEGLSTLPEYDDTVHQGYSIVVPIGVKNEKL